METIYNWLLHNIGNEANVFTILNVQRQTDTEGISTLEIMARTKDFRRVNLLVEPMKKTNSPDSEADESTDQVTDDTYTFADEDQVIAYLSEGETTQSSSKPEGIHVSLTELSDDSETLAFPPK
ncbi:hypothetical protein [Spirosoma endophyticum]|uniref:Uncharacterized protein n=1 Tax=Spirosoma endophyticum TaxID=662367 RepID=A0A1I1MU56_9BACT|nr:hypothetical protein [Spirosoma endophyticum]SFC88901.1 hypothetical protein SAMN05216167_102711 [Spirosoma endophyticum]